MQSLRLLSDDITAALIDVITFSDVNLKDGVRYFHYQARENSRFLSYLGMIRISIPGLNPGFPYLVCKKIAFVTSFFPSCKPSL